MRIRTITDRLQRIYRNVTSFVFAFTSIQQRLRLHPSILYNVFNFVFFVYANMNLPSFIDDNERYV
jgi:hypothetical protein